MAPDEPRRGGPTRAQQRRERERAAARATILTAALDLARCEGWDAVTMRRLADRIEYSANFAYRYFAGRDDILLALVRDGFARLRDEMSAAADAAPLTEAEAERGAAAVRRAAHAYLAFALAEPDLYQAMYSLGGVRVPTADTFDDGQRVGDVFTAVLRRAGDQHADEHVLQLWATAHGLIALLAVGRVDIDAARLHALLDAAVGDVLTRALPASARESVAATHPAHEEQP